MWLKNIYEWKETELLDDALVISIILMCKTS